MVRYTQLQIIIIFNKVRRQDGSDLTILMLPIVLTGVVVLDSRFQMRMRGVR